MSRPSVRVGPPEAGDWRSLYVGEIFIRRLRNPKSIAAWIERFESAPDPQKAAEDYRRARIERERHLSWKGEIRKAVRTAFPGVNFREATTGSEYGWLGNVVLVRISNHPYTEGRTAPLVDVYQKGQKPSEIVAKIQNLLQERTTCHSVNTAPSVSSPAATVNGGLTATTVAPTDISTRVKKL